MKNFTLFFVAFLLLNLSLTAQNSVTLNIHHKLAAEDFAMSMATKNNLDHDFNVTRLQYYISEISVVHDGGTETAIEDLYVLVNAANETAVDLGSFEITNVEAVKFHIGVDEANNHLDPALYPSGHPLAPSFPSMHWGWSAGYRFIAIEGKGGSSLSQTYQLHGLGDNNYFQTTVDVTAAAENGVVVINLDADYTRSLEDIAVQNGVIVHGDYGQAKKAVENFRDYVFSASENATSTVDFSEVQDFKVFPNPTSGAAILVVESTDNLTYEVSVSDILGREIQYFPTVQSNASVDLNLDNAGLYIISLIKEGQAVITKKLTVN